MSLPRHSLIANFHNAAYAGDHEEYRKTLHALTENSGGIMLTVKEAATEMGLSAVRVRQLCQDGRIKGAVKLGGWAWMIPTPIVRYQPPRGRPPIGEPHPSDSH